MGRLSWNTRVGPKCNPMYLCKSEADLTHTAEKVMCRLSREKFEDVGVIQAKECQQPLEAERGKNCVLPYSLQNVYGHVYTLIIFQ